MDGEPFDAVVLATSSTEAARLARAAQASLPAPEARALDAWATTAEALRFTAIGTVYAQAAPGTPAVLPQPMLARSSWRWSICKPLV